MNEPITHSCVCEVLKTAHVPVERVAAEPSSDLLDRAQVGWEHFLSTFQAVSDE